MTLLEESQFEEERNLEQERADVRLREFNPVTAQCAHYDQEYGCAKNIGEDLTDHEGE
jgi:hypothetical protein